MDSWIPFCFGIIICFIIMAFVMNNVHVDAYKEGQVDAINGKISYQLTTHDDKTQTWEKIDKKLP